MLARLNIILLALSVLVAIQAWAQQEPVLTRQQAKVAELLTLELELLDSRLSGKNSKENVQKTVLLLEKLVGLMCAPQLTATLQHQGQPTAPNCVKLLTRLLELHPTNPVGVCAQRGIDSGDCQLAYSEQYIDDYDNYSPTSESQFGLEASDLDAKLSGLEIQQQASSLATEIINLKRAYQDEPTAENQYKIMNAVNRYVRTACRDVHIRIIHTKPGKNKMAGYREVQGREDDPLKELVSNFEKSVEDASPTPQPDTSSRKKKYKEDPWEKAFLAKSTEPEQIGDEKIAPFWRVRYLTDECFSALTTAMQHNQAPSVWYCYREGFTSPNCVRALRAERQADNQARQQRSVRPNGSSGGFSEF